MVLGKKTLQVIENKFFNYAKIKAAIIDARAEQDSKGGFTGGDSGHSRISDPTAATAIKHVSPLASVYIKDGLFDMKVHNPEKWLKVMDYTFNVYKNQLVGIMAQRRYIKGEKPDYTYDNMGIGMRTYYDWRDDFVTQAAIFAIGEGLIAYDRTME